VPTSVGLQNAGQISSPTVNEAIATTPPQTQTLQPEVQQTAPIVAPVAVEPKPAIFRFHFDWKKLLKTGGIALLTLLIIGGIIAVGINFVTKKAGPSTSVGSRFSTVQIPLTDFISQDGLSLVATRSLVINGPLKVNDSFIISPSAQPSTADQGQIYYDKNSKQLAYYNGSKFVPVAGSDTVVQSVGGISGNLSLGNGISGNGNQLSNSGVLSVQGQTGAVNFVAGTGVAINGTTLSNTGVTSLGGQTGDITIGNGLSITSGALQNTGVISATGSTGITVTDDGAGNVTISNSGAGSGTVQSPGGTAGKIAKFTGVQTIADSLLSESGTTVTVGGDLSVTGGLTLGTALGVSNGGTGATSLTTNGVVIGQGSGALTAVAAGSSGLCFMSTAGAPAFSACPGGGGGVTSLNGLTGALTVANASAAGSTITINDASTSQKGIAQFNSTNFSASGGVVNTTQDINSTASPTFSTLSLSSSQASNPMLLVNNTNGAASGNLLDLQVSGSSKFAVTPAGAVNVTGTINGQTISSAANFTGTLAVASTANLNGGANVTGTLGVNTITPTSSLTIGATGQSVTIQGNASSVFTATSSGNTTTLSFQAPTANVTYRLPTATAGSYDLCTTVGNCAGTGGGVTTAGGTAGKIAKFTGSQTLADSLLSESGSTVTVTGDLSVTSGLTLGSALSLANGGTGATSLTVNGVVIGQGSSALTTVSTVTSGQCLVSTAGAPAFATCPGSGGVSSLNGLTGALSIANSTASGSTITLNDASTSQKGIAQFNSTNFSVSSGTVNTIQDINSSAAPTFGALTLTSSQASNPMLLVNNTNTLTTGNLLDVQLNGSSKLSVSPAGAVNIAGTINGQTISSAANFTGSLAVASTANLNGGANVTGTLGVNTITPTSSLTIGATGQSFTLQGNASSVFTATNAGNTTTLSFQAPTANVTYRLPTAAAGSYDLCTTVGNCAGSGSGVTTGGGTIGKIAKFVGSQAIGDSLLSESGTTVTVGGDLSVTGGLTLGSALSLANGGTGTTTLTANGVVIGQGTSPLTTVVAGSSGLCLVSTAGAPSFATCPGVSSLNGLTGALSIANASGSGSTITINDASTSQKGIAQFNSTNFSTSSGTINTIQNINSSATPTFGALTLTSSQASNPMLLVNNTNTLASGNLLDLQLNGSSKLSVSPAGSVTMTGTINGQTISSAASFSGTLAVASTANLNGGANVTGTLGVNTITPTSTLTVGATSQTLTLQGNSSSVFTATSGASTTTLSFQAPTANVTYRLPTAAAGSYDLCTTVGNCAGSGTGVTTSGGTTGKLAKFVAGQAIGDSLLSESGSTVTSAGTMNLTTGHTYQINGIDICTSSGCTAAGGSSNYVQLQSSTPGTAQTGNLNITGTAIAGSVQASTVTATDLVTGSLTADQPLKIGNGSTLLFQVNTTGSVQAQTSTNSATAFQVLNSTSVPQFVVDSANSRVYVGNPTADSTGALLVLDTKNTSGDPTGVAGAMYYNSNLGMFRCYDVDHWRDCIESARTSFHYANDFIGTGSDNVTTPFTNGTGALVNGGAVDGLANHPGVAQLDTGTTATGLASISTNDTNGRSILLGGSDTWRYTSVQRINTLSTSSQRYTFRTGMFDQVVNDDDGTNGCLLKYSDSINSGKWQGVCNKAGTETTCDMGVSPTAGAWMRADVVVTGSLATFQINGVTGCTVSTNIPTTATMFETTLRKTVGTTDSTVDVDYVELLGQFGSSR